MVSIGKNFSQINSSQNKEVFNLLNQITNFSETNKNDVPMHKGFENVGNTEKVDIANFAKRELGGLGRQVDTLA